MEKMMSNSGTVPCDPAMSRGWNMTKTTKNCQNFSVKLLPSGKLT